MLDATVDSDVPTLPKQIRHDPPYTQREFARVVQSLTEVKFGVLFSIKMF